jgi:AcrR family transcriptional regulator
MRLTRKEKQEQTHECLMRSAARVFRRRGLDRASIDEVAEDAGYTKGAFYANFKSKEELYLAMLDRKFGERLEALDRALARDERPSEQARHFGEDVLHEMVVDEDWRRLFLEFSAYAARDEDFRAELMTRYAAIRERIVRAFEARLERLGVDSPVPVEEVTEMACMMASGFLLEQMIHPDLDEGLHSRMLEIFYAGLAAMRPAPAGSVETR